MMQGVGPMDVGLMVVVDIKNKSELFCKSSLFVLIMFYIMNTTRFFQEKYENRK